MLCMWFMAVRALAITGVYPAVDTPTSCTQLCQSFYSCFRRTRTMEAYHPRCDQDTSGPVQPRACPILDALFCGIISGMALPNINKQQRAVLIFCQQFPPQSCAQYCKIRASASPPRLLAYLASSLRWPHGGFESRWRPCPKCG